jgi:hypothetical protein
MPENSKGPLTEFHRKAIARSAEPSEDNEIYQVQDPYKTIIVTKNAT